MNSFNRGNRILQYFEFAVWVVDTYRRLTNQSLSMQLFLFHHSDIFCINIFFIGTLPRIEY